GESRRIQQMPSIGCGRCVEAQHVAGGEQSLPFDVPSREVTFDLRRSPGAVSVLDVHPEGACPLRHRSSDPTHAENPELRASQVAPEIIPEAPALELSCTETPLCLR